MNTVLIDTNVLVYAHDAADQSRQARAQQLLERLQPLRTGRLSTQVLGEFFRVVTQRIRPPVPVSDAVRLVEALAQSFEVWAIDDLVVIEAARGVREHGFAFGDSQVWATARLHGARTVVTEDFENGRAVEGITFLDPFMTAVPLDAFIATIS